MIRVVVNHDLIARPVPVADDGVIVGENAPVKVVEPEAFAISALKVEYVLGTDASREVTMRPRVIQVEPGVVASRVVADPFVVTGVHVRDFRMSLVVGGNAMLFGLMMLRRLMLGCLTLRRRGVRLCG